MSRRYIMLLLLFGLLLGACRPGVPVPAVTTPTETRVNTTPAASTATATATLVPPTETALPPTMTQTAAPSATPQSVVVGPDNFPENVNPLTGLTVSDLDLLNRRPVSVKIQIIPRTQRPPFGVSLADIVFDFYQNLGATRFHAIFYGNDAERASPIRSARLFDYSLIQMYKTIVAYGGADARIDERLRSAPFGNRLFSQNNTRCPPLCRVDPNGFNYLVVNTAELSAFATTQGISNDRQNLNGMSFNPQAPEGGSEAQQVFVRFNFSNYNRWDYDPENGVYLRFQETANDENGSGERYAPLIDGLTEEQVAASNVVVLLATHSFAFNTRPGTNEVVDIELGRTGTAYAFRDGQGYELRWSRPSPDSVLFLTYPDGTFYPYKNGNTWYQVVGQTSKVEQQDDSTWRFTFQWP